MNYRKLITEKEILALLTQGDWGLPPLSVEAVEAHVRAGNTDTVLDALITFGWYGKSYPFGAEIRRLWTPKAVMEASDQVLRTARAQKLQPLVIVPYLSEDRLRELELRGVSGIDLCGNGIVVVPGELLVFRSGSPNRFHWEGRIKNVYRGSSAIVARIFLRMREFPSVGDALGQIRTLGGAVTFSTVSKVCKSLEQDLVIERTQGETPLSRKLRLLQPEKLLDLLRDNYVPPEVTSNFSGKFVDSREALVQRLLAWEKKAGRKVVLTGASSVESYAVMARELVLTYYCSDIAGLKKSLGEDLKETDRFANVRLQETKDQFVYFDRRPGLVASSVQTYLELVTGEKREKETAEQVRRFILSEPHATEGQR